MAGLNVDGLYTFNGPFQQFSDLMKASGVYLISAFNGTHHVVLDIGESEDIHTRVRSHDRSEQWRNHAGSLPLHVSTFYCDEPTRMAMERQLRAHFNPACGER